MLLIKLNYDEDSKNLYNKINYNLKMLFGDYFLFSHDLASIYKN